MTDPELPAKPEAAKTFEIDVEPTVARRFARRLAEARALQTRVELLAGALAYRLFVLLLPSTLLFVSGLGVYAGAVDESPSTVAKDAGLQGLIASQVASAASSGARWLVFIVMVPAVLYA